MLPAGEDLTYNAMTYDGFPNWAALGKGLPTRETWQKVHPEMDITQCTSRVAAVSDRPRVDIVKLVELIREK